MVNTNYSKVVRLAARLTELTSFSYGQQVTVGSYFGDMLPLTQKNSEKYELGPVPMRDSFEGGQLRTRFEQSQAGCFCLLPFFMLIYAKRLLVSASCL